LKDKMTKDISIADPTISQVLERFLEDQSMRLSPSTMRKYRYIIESLKDCLNSYAYDSLDEEESKLYDQLYAEEIEFCDIFGSEKILPEISEFLGYYMVRKAAAGKDILRASGTVTKKLAKWLHAEGFVDAMDAQFAVEEGSDAIELLPKADGLSDMLYDLTERIPPDEIIEEVWDQFGITEVKPNGVTLSAGEHKIPIKLPQEVIDRWDDRLEASLRLGRTKDGWHIIGTGNVYPL